MNKNTLPTTLPDNWRQLLSRDLIRLPLYTTSGVSAIADLVKTIVKNSYLYKGITFDSVFINALSSIIVPTSYKSYPELMTFYSKNKLIFDQFLASMHNVDHINFFLDNWYDSKRNFIYACSQLEGWQPNNFALKLDAKSTSTLDYKLGTSLLINFLGMYWEFRGFKYESLTRRFDSPYNFSSGNHFAGLSFLTILLEVYKDVVLDGINVPTKRGAHFELNYDQIQGDVISFRSIKQIKKHLDAYPVTKEVDGKYINLFENHFHFNFKTFMSVLPQRFLYTDLTGFHDSFLNDIFVKLSEDDGVNLFKSGLYQYLQLDKPLPKLVVVKKLFNLFAILEVCRQRFSYDERLSYLDLFNNSQYTFDVYFQNKLSEMRIHTNNKVKVRLPEGGFTFTDTLSYNQLSAKLFDCFVSTTLDDSLLINLHPVSQILSSHSERWTSCHNVADTGSHRRGAYAAGVWEMAQSGGFIVSRPETYTNVDQCFVPLVYRSQFFVDKELSVLRQHLPYPGRSRNDLSVNEAKTQRVILHNIFALYHGYDTSSWLSVTSTNEDSVTLSGFNWVTPKTLGNTQHSLREICFDRTHTPQGGSIYHGYQSESTFCFSIINYPQPNIFTLPIAKTFVPISSDSLVLPEFAERYPYNDMNISVRPFKISPYVVDGNPSSTLNGYLTADTKQFIKNPIKVFDKRNFFLYETSTQHVTCSKCKRFFFTLNNQVCDDCVSVSGKKLFSNFLSGTTTYFKASSLDELKDFLMSLSAKHKDVLWRSNSSLTSVTIDRNIILSLQDKKLSIKVTKISEGDLVNVSDVVFE